MKDHELFLRQLLRQEQLFLRHLDDRLRECEDGEMTKCDNEIFSQNY